MKNKTRADLKQEIKTLNERIEMLSIDVTGLQFEIEVNNCDYENLETSYIEYSDNHIVSNTKVLLLSLMLITTVLCLL